MKRRAKIVATVGPASSDEKTLVRLLECGVDVFRLNFSHGTRDGHRELIRRIRGLAESRDRFVAILGDLMGPRYRIATLTEPVELEEGDLVTLGRRRHGVDLPVTEGAILKHIEVGERVLIDNGLIELRVTRKRDGAVRARVVSGGRVSSRKGINLPDSDLPFRVSKKDREDVSLAVEEGADYLAASYVGRARDVETIRRLVVKAGGDLPVVAKLERARAVDNLDEIVRASDAVMVARGDLGVEVPLHQVPVLQKRIIDSTWRLGRPVIVATQMLESMMEQPRPTRAESTDVANAVFDGADALMLSGETAAGRYPVESVQTMDRIIQESERYHISHAATALNAPGSYDLEPPAGPDALEIPETVSSASVLAAKQVQARGIVTLSQGGFTARMLARRRPSTAVFAITRDRATCQRLQLVWGVRALYFEEEVVHHAEVVELIDRHMLGAGLAKPGDVIVILMGDPIRERPPTNLMRIHRVRPAVTKRARTRERSRSRR